MTSFRSRHYSGQILLLTLLVVAVGTTIALSLIGGSTADIEINKQIEESQIAFNAAEAGIEEALKTGVSNFSGTVPGVTRVSYNTTVAIVGGTTGVYTLPLTTQPGTGSTIWFVDHTTPTQLNMASYYTGSNITVCWDNTQTPGIGVTLYYFDTTDPVNGYRVARYAYDSQRVVHQNGFSAPTSNANGCGLPTNAYSVISLPPTGTNIPILMHLRPYYAPTLFAVESDPGFALPQQGYRIDSTGQTESGVSKSILVYQDFPSPDITFDAAMISSQAITK